MNTVKLFSEAVEEVQYITEAKEGGGKNYKIKGIFLQADIKNRNGRVYPMEILQKEVARYNKKFINESRAYGELGHPDGPTVNLERVSHMVTELYPDGKNFVGEAKIMETPMGKIVKNIMNEGGKLGVSSRGMGSLNQKNGAKLHIKRLWWGLVQGTANDATGHVQIIEQGDSDVTLIDLAGSGHYDGTAGLIKSNATNTGATSGDMEMSCQGTSGFVLIEFKKDENYTS